MLKGNVPVHTYKMGTFGMYFCTEGLIFSPYVCTAAFPLTNKKANKELK